MSKWPEHKDPQGEHAAKAPYNFVPLPSRVVTVDPGDLPDQDRYYPDRRTGWIDCELTTASPLYVRAALMPDQFKRSLDTEEKERPWGEQARNNPDFFNRGDPLRPVIPGSSLRGMLRALVEIVSYSKVQWVTGRKLVYRAVGDTTSHGEQYRARLMSDDGEGSEDGKRYYQYTPLMQAGYMKRTPTGDWQIQPAKSIGGTTFARISDQAIPQDLTRWHNCRNAYTIWVQPGPYEYQKVRGGFIRVRYARVMRASTTQAPGLTEARLVYSGWMANKRTEAVIYEEDPQAKPLPLDDELVRAYRDQYTDIRTDRALRGGKKTSLLGPNGVLEQDQPVFYLVEGGKVQAFSHTMMLRIPYQHSPRELVPEALRREADTDLAEAIFGYSKSEGEGKARAYAGRVSVGDALLAKAPPDGVWLNDGKPIVPRILGSPKPTTFQHYLAQQHPDPIPVKGQFADGRPRTQMELSDYASRSPSEAVLRGHKLYWHKGKVDVPDVQEEDPDDKHDSQHTQIKPVRDGVTFRFQIRFENLSDVELGALLWVLDKARDEAYRLKLGMGKPYGLGAVQIAPTLHLEDRRGRYRQLFDVGNWAAPAQSAGDEWGRIIRAFESFILDRLGVRKTEHLERLTRIKALLTMLTWPGPDPADTRYLEIEHPDPRARRGKVNEYKDRPVLPGPRAVKLRLGAKPRPPADGLPPGYERGKVRYFGQGPNQSFGFIIPDQGGPDLFVHRSQLAEGVITLKPGQKVIFRVGRGMKGLQAEDVRPG